MTNKEKYAKSGFWLCYREAIGLILRFAGNLILIRIIGASEYGIYILASGMISFLKVFPQMGINVFLIKEDEKYAPSAFFLLSVISVFLLCVCVLLRIPIVNLVKHKEVLVPFTVMLIAIPFSLLRIIPLAILEKQFSFKYIAKTEAFGQFLFIIVSIFLALLDFKALSCVIGVVIMDAYISIKLFQQTKINLKDISKAKIVKILKFGFDYSKYLVTSEIKKLILPLIVAPHFSTTIIGYVGIIDKVLDNMNMLSNVFRRLSVPIISSTSNVFKSIQYLMTIQVCAVGFLLFALSFIFPLFIQWYMPDATQVTMSLYAVLSIVTLSKIYNTIPITYLNLHKKNNILSCFLIAEFIITIIIFKTTFNSLSIVSYGVCQLSILITVASLLFVLRKNLSLKCFHVSGFIFIIFSAAMLSKYAIAGLIVMVFSSDFKNIVSTVYDQVIRGKNARPY